MDLTALKNNVESFIKERISQLDTSYHSAVRDFVSFVEGKDAEAKAADMLRSKGYTVIEPGATPPTVTPQDGPPPTDPV